LISAQNQVEYTLLSVIELLGLDKDEKVEVVFFGSLKEEYPVRESWILINARGQLNSAQLGYLKAVYNYKEALFNLMDTMGVDYL